MTLDTVGNTAHEWTCSHTYTHGRWQSIMGEIGTQSHTHFPSLSLKHTAHRDIHTHICMNEHTHCASEAQDGARLAAAMSYSAMVTILAEEIKYLKRLFDKKTHLSLKYCTRLPWISMNLETWSTRLNLYRLALCCRQDAEIRKGMLHSTCIPNSVIWGNTDKQ